MPDAPALGPGLNAGRQRAGDGDDAVADVAPAQRSQLALAQSGVRGNPNELGVLCVLFAGCVAGGGPVAVLALGERVGESLDLGDCVGVEGRRLRLAALVCHAYRVVRQAGAANAVVEYGQEQCAALVDRSRGRSGLGERVEEFLDLERLDVARGPVAERAHDVSFRGAVRLCERVTVVGKRGGLRTLDPLEPLEIVAGEVAERQPSLRVGRLDCVLGDDRAGVIVRGCHVEVAVAGLPAAWLAAGRDPCRAEAALDLPAVDAKHDLVEGPRALRAEL